MVAAALVPEERLGEVSVAAEFLTAFLAGRVALWRRLIWQESCPATPIRHPQGASILRSRIDSQNRSRPAKEIAKRTAELKGQQRSSQQQTR